MLEYITVNDYLKTKYGKKIYKLALDGGFTCPNRDGRLGTRGCIFCSDGGSGDFASSSCLSVSEQIAEAKKKVSSKMPESSDRSGSYIAYFQAFTSTYGPVDKMRHLFFEAANDPDIAIISIATRPDCLGEEVLKLLKELSAVKPVWVELGLQTIHEETARYIRRGYDLEVFDRAVKDLKAIEITVIVHLILGLPGETPEMMAESAKYVSDRLTESPHICGDGIKLQLLHVLKNTDLADDYEKGMFECLNMEDYFDILRKCLNVIDKKLVIHRITGDGAKKDLIAPLWSADKKKVLNSWTKYRNEH